MPGESLLTGQLNAVIEGGTEGDGGGLDRGEVWAAVSVVCFALELSGVERLLYRRNRGADGRNRGPRPVRSTPDPTGPSRGRGRAHSAETLCW